MQLLLSLDLCTTFHLAQDYPSSIRTKGCRDGVIMLIDGAHKHFSYSMGGKFERLVVFIFSFVFLGHTRSFSYWRSHLLFLMIPEPSAAQTDLLYMSACSIVLYGSSALLLLRLVGFTLLDWEDAE